MEIFTDVNSIANNSNIHTDKIAKLMMKHSPFLDEFHFDNFIEKNGMNMWVFTKVFPDYTFRIVFGEKNDRWRYKVFVYWKKQTKDATAGVGKEFEYKAGPFKSFSEVIVDIEKKLKNNPIMGKHLYDDNSELNMDREAIPFLKKLKKIGERLSSINDVHFDDLKKIYKNVKNISDDKLMDYCRVKNQKEADKQDFLLDLQKVNKLDFYDGMKSMGHIK